MGSTNFVPQMWLPDIQVWLWSSSISQLSNFHLVDINIITSNNFVYRSTSVNSFCCGQLSPMLPAWSSSKTKMWRKIFWCLWNCYLMQMLLQILYTVSTEVIIACPMKFAAYPLDHQLCKFLVTLSFCIQHHYDCYFHHPQQHRYHHINYHLLSFLHFNNKPIPIQTLAIMTNVKVGSYIHDNTQIYFTGSWGHDTENQRAQQ